MIPLRLELRNFMSYGDEPTALDLTGMHTLCLSGENGHGKSALLDAITWALWGESRAGKNRHDELVRIGADEMGVQFTFQMDSHTYRVLRKRSRKASGNQWELQQQDEGGGWRALTGVNTTETGQVIQKLLRMSYDTFLNSAYLRQGQADQFVQQSPSKRKEILAEILDLSRYERLSEKARERMKIAQNEAVDLEREINLLDAELRHEDDHRQRLTALTARGDALESLKNTLLAEYRALQGQKSALETQQEHAERLRVEIAEYDTALLSLAVQQREHAQECQKWQALLARREEICRDYDALLAARQRVDELAQAVSRFYKGQKLLDEARLEWAKEEQTIRARADQAVRDYEEAAQRLRELPDILERKAQAEESVRTLQDAQARWRAATDALHEARQTFQRLEQEAKFLKAQIAQWDERLDALANQQGACRVCNSLLPPEKVAATQDEYRRERDTLIEEQQRLWAEAKRAKSQIQSGQAEVESLEKSLAGMDREQQRLGQLSQQALEFEALSQRLPKLLAARDLAMRIYQEADFAPELRAKITRYEAALKQYETAEADQEQARAQAVALQDAERQHLQLDQAQTALTQAEVYLRRAERDLQTTQERRTRADQQLRGLPDAASALAALNLRQEELKTEERTRDAEEKRVREESGQVQGLLNRCAAQKIQRAEKSGLMATAKKDQEAHDQLTKAFSKNGIQAVIIEGAIPELQEEANRLLDRLTDGDMSVFFETVRQAKTKGGGPIETLDIKVSDSLGTRPLEMYSGGEGFRAAFAIRIALSKLLAHRAGAKLQTLIIDEGFGTQDGKGREKLVEALGVIQEDFEKIIVITHIDELKDSFPTRVEISKTPRGSQITVLEGAAG